MQSKSHLFHTVHFLYKDQHADTRAMHAHCVPDVSPYLGLPWLKDAKTILEEENVGPGLVSIPAITSKIAT